MTMPSSAGAPYRRAEAVTSTSQTGQSTGALLILAGVAAPGPGHQPVPGPGWPSLPVGGRAGRAGTSR